MNILVTGGFGYIGSQVVPELARRGHTVDIAARSVPEHFASLAQQHAFREWDIREAWRGASPARYDLLVHLAAANDVDCVDAALALQVNALGTRHALEFCRAHAVPAIIYVSTFQVYGVWHGTVTDDTPPAPANDYGVTHWFAEEYVRMYGRTGGPDHVILRPTNIYGAPAHRDVDRWSLVPNCFCREAVESGVITLRSSGLQARDFISLTSLADRIAGVATRLNAFRNRTYTVGCGGGITIREIALLVAQRYEARFGLACELRVLSEEPREMQPLRVTSARAAEAGLLAPSLERMSAEIDLIFDLLKGN
jgi:UDP-glucose 4-epimerase